MNRAGLILESILNDARDALRSLRRTPGVTVAAIVILALAIGANTVVWTALRATLLTELDAPRAERLVVPRLTFQETPGAAPEMFPWSYPKYRVLRDTEDRLIDPVAGYTTTAVSLSGVGEATRVEMEMADPEIFELLGAQPSLGTLYSATSVRSDAMVAVVSHSLWSNELGGERDVVGRSITVNGNTLSVLGVLPRGFRGLGGESDLWVPFEAAPTLLNPRRLEWAHAHWFYVIGRLRDGVDLEQARAQTIAIGEAIEEAYPDEGSSALQGADLFSLDEVRRNPDAETAVLLLVSAAGLVLLIACGNLATLFLSRGADRARDAAIRRALGAGGWRIIRRALVESWLLAGLGAAAGLVVATFGVRALTTVWPDRFVMGEAKIRYFDPEPLGLDASTMLVALLLAAGSSILFGILPALSLLGRARLPSLRDTGVGAAESAGRRRGFGLRGTLVVAQVALTLVLVSSTALLVQSLWRLSNVSTGIEAPEQVLTARYEIPQSSAAAESSTEFHRRFTERMAAVPGVVSTSVASASPFAGHDWITGVRRIDGQPDYTDAERPAVGVAAVDDRFFATLGVELIAGRLFDSRDNADSPPVAVLSRSAALELYGDDAPIGRGLAIGIELTPSDSDTMAEVIGVVEDVLYERPDRGILPDTYVSLRQQPMRHAVAFARTSVDPITLTNSLRAALAELDPTMPLYGAATLGDLRHEGMDATRLLGSLLAIFAAIALTLAIVGTYGTMSCWVDGRGRELGLRLALGARAQQLLRLVLGRGLGMLAAGAALGGVAALVSARLLENALFEVHPRDPVVLGGAVVLMIAAGLFACWLPARRAGRTDPSTVLRGD